MFYILISILAGMTIVFSRLINFKLSDRIGLYQSTFFNYITGLIGSIVLIIFNPYFSPLTHMLEPRDYLMFFGGTVGVVVVTLSSYITPKLPVFYATLFMFIGQIFVAIIIDALLLDSFSMNLLIGNLLVLAGLSYNLYIDTKSKKDA